MFTNHVCRAAGADNAKPIDWRKMMTVAKVKRDTSGKLLPLQSYRPFDAACRSFWTIT